MPALSEDVLVIATRDGWLIGLDPGNGTELWARDVLQGALLADPLVLESGILYVSEQGSLLRVAPATGAVETLFVRSGE